MYKFSNAFAALPIMGWFCWDLSADLTCLSLQIQNHLAKVNDAVKEESNCPLKSSSSEEGSSKNVIGRRNDISGKVQLWWARF